VVIQGLHEDSKYFYKIELINFEGNINYSREFSSEFKNGECWGYNRFYKLDQLEKDGFIDLPTGKVSLRYFVRPMNYIQLSRDQKNYIAKLQRVLNNEVDKQLVEVSKVEQKGEGEELAKKSDSAQNDIEVAPNRVIEVVNKPEMIIEEEHKTQHLIDNFDNNIDHKVVMKNQNIEQVRNKPLSHENQPTFPNNLTNRNIPAIDNFIYSDEGNLTLKSR
jgi:tripartite motif-containing protein 37